MEDLLMPHDVVVREAKPLDAPRLAELSGVLGYPVTADVLAARLARILVRAEDAVLVAEAPPGGVIGWLHASEHELLEMGRHGEILGLVVDADHRGGGVGKALITRAEAWAAARGLDALHVRSNVIRRESHPFYQRLGYVRTKTQHSYRKDLTEARVR
jgi:GNAT superfamily N-acetyltransferase